MRFLAAFLLLALLFFSCSGNKVKIPAGILPPDTMVQVLTDIYLVQASHQYNIPIDTTDSTYSYTFNYVWKKHKITDSIYKKSMNFYIQHTPLLDSIYDNATNNLMRQKAKLMNKKG